MFRTATLTAAALLFAAPALAEPQRYTLDPSHSQIVASWDHLGFSTTYAVWSGFEGEIMLDPENPANSSVTVSMQATDMYTGWEERYAHFMSEEFFDAAADAGPTGNPDDVITFSSTAVEVTGEDTATITGDLTLNGVTKEVVLDAKLNAMGDHPMANKPWAGFDATTTLLRSDYGLGAFAPFVADEVQVEISVEAMRAEGDDA